MMEQGDAEFPAQLSLAQRLCPSAQQQTSGFAAEGAARSRGFRPLSDSPGEGSSAGWDLLRPERCVRALPPTSQSNCSPAAFYRAG